MLVMTAFTNWLQLKFEEWEKSKGRRRQSYAEFARYLEVSAPSLNRWLMGDVAPTGDNLQKLADKLGYEIYVVLGIEPPYPQFVHEITSTYNVLSEEQRDIFQEDMDKFLTDWLIEHGGKRTK